MTTSETHPNAMAALDAATVERLSRGFHRTFESLEVDDDLFSPEVFFDLNMPVWRFQMQGREAWAAQLTNLSQGPARVLIERTVATESGFVTEHVEVQHVNGEDHSARRMWLCQVRDGRITEVVGYCSGEWDEALRERHAREAPMIRP